MSGTADLIYSLRKDKVLGLLKEGKRLDGRGLDDYRKVEVQTEIIGNAEGSAKVKLGETEVIVGTKFVIGEPFPDTPNEGGIVVNIELLPLASPVFEAGPPGSDAIELSRVVDRSIRESKAVDFEKLCVTEGKAAFMIFIDGYILNEDGNLFDAVSIAALNALLTSKVPKVEDEKIVKDEYTGTLKLLRKPLLTSFAKINDHILTDPGLVEEKIMDTSFHISTTEDDLINACQKSGSGAFTKKELFDMAEKAFVKAKELRKKVL